MFRDVPTARTATRDRLLWLCLMGTAIFIVMLIIVLFLADVASSVATPKATPNATRGDFKGTWFKPICPDGDPGIFWVTIHSEQYGTQSYWTCT